MPPCLDEDALACVDQNDGKIGSRGARHHVAGILLVARAVGDNELALFSGEEPVSDVDGDTLFALGSKAINEQREIDLLPLRADPLAVGFERRQLILEDHL